MLNKSKNHMFFRRSSCAEENEREKRKERERSGEREREGERRERERENILIQKDCEKEEKEERERERLLNDSSSAVIPSLSPSSSHPHTLSTSTKIPWTDQEDEIIRKCKKDGVHKWSHIARLLPNRAGKQIRERWQNQLDPSLIREAWSEREDEQLSSLHSIHGNHWSRICQEMRGRSENAVKNRWNSAVFREREREREKERKRYKLLL